MSPEADEALHRRIVPGGAKLDDIFQTETDGVKLSLNIAQASWALQDVALFGAGMVGSSEAVTTNRGFSLFGGSSQSGNTLEAFGSDEIVTEAAANLTPKKGWFDTVAHGMGDGQNFSMGGKVVKPNELYEMMLQRGYQPGTRIRLAACWSGSCPNGAAQQISNLSRCSGCGTKRSLAGARFATSILHTETFYDF